MWFLLLPHPLQRTETCVRNCPPLAGPLPHCSELSPDFCLPGVAERAGKAPVSVITVLLMYGDTTTKATYGKKHLVGWLLTISEGEFMVMAAGRQGFGSF